NALNLVNARAHDIAPTLSRASDLLTLEDRLTRASTLATDGERANTHEDDRAIIRALVDNIGSALDTVNALKNALTHSYESPDTLIRVRNLIHDFESILNNAVENVNAWVQIIGRADKTIQNPEIARVLIRELDSACARTRACIFVYTHKNANQLVNSDNDS